MATTKRKSTQFDIKLGKKVRLLRNEKMVSQSDLAKHLGVTFQQIQKYEKGQNRICVESLVRIAEALDVPHNIFLESKPDSTFEEFDIKDREFTELYKYWKQIKCPKQKKAILKFMRTLVEIEG